MFEEVTAGHFDSVYIPQVPFSMWFSWLQIGPQGVTSTDGMIIPNNVIYSISGKGIFWREGFVSRVFCLFGLQE